MQRQKELEQEMSKNVQHLNSLQEMEQKLEEMQVFFCFVFNMKYFFSLNKLNKFVPIVLLLLNNYKDYKPHWMSAVAI
jgi:hypothetical protein